MNVLRVAGSSSGGSSYMARIVRNYNKNGLKIIVSSGKAQSSVVNLLNECVQDLAFFSGKKLNVVIVKE